MSGTHDVGFVMTNELITAALHHVYHFMIHSSHSWNKWMKDSSLHSLKNSGKSDPYPLWIISQSSPIVVLSLTTNDGYRCKRKKEKLNSNYKVRIQKQGV